MKTVKLVSGGIDSVILAKTFDGLNVYIDIGQPYARYEIKALEKLEIDFDLITIKSKFIYKDIFINNRNLLFASIVNMVYSPDVILMAGLKDDNCKDKTPDAFKKISNILSEQSDHTVTVNSPFWETTKGELIYKYKNKNELVKTFSCYNPKLNGDHCGDCPACLRKKIALETNGVKCNYELTDRIIKTYLAKIHTYSPDRISRFFIWLMKNKKIYAVDMDGVICEEKGKYSERAPIIKNIKRVNELSGIVVIYTARLDCDREETKKWLQDHNVHYDCLITNKLPYDVLFDDRKESVLI